MEAPIVFAWLNPEYEQICPEIGFEATICCEQHPRDLGWIPLYAQREWVGLTDEELNTIYTEATSQTLRPQDERLAFAFAQGVAAKLKEENT